MQDDNDTCADGGLEERRRGDQGSALWGERLEAHLRWSRDLARRQADGAALTDCQREQRALEILARMAGQSFLLERVARILLQVAPEAQEARFLVGQGVTGHGFVQVTTEAGRDLRWERTRFESAHELGEDWWVEMEDQFIGDDTLVGDCVTLRLQTREITYLHAGDGDSADGSPQSPPLAAL